MSLTIGKWYKYTGLIKGYIFITKFEDVKDEKLNRKIYGQIICMNNEIKFYNSFIYDVYITFSEVDENYIKRLKAKCL